MKAFSLFLLLISGIAQAKVNWAHQDLDFLDQASLAHLKSEYNSCIPTYYFPSLVSPTQKSSAVKKCLVDKILKAEAGQLKTFSKHRSPHLCGGYEPRNIRARMNTLQSTPLNNLNERHLLIDLYSAESYQQALESGEVILCG